MGGKNVIELNGQQFDAETGKRIGGHSRAAVKKSLDGFVATASASASAASHASHNFKRAVNKHAAHQPEKAKTLRREGLLKPEKSQIKLSKSQLKSSDSLVASTAVLLDTRASKKALAAARRASLSEQITQHPKVQHFAGSVANYAGPKVANIGISLPKPKVPHPKPVGIRPEDSRAHLQTLINKGLAKSRSHEQPEPSIKKREQTIVPYVKRGVILVILLVIFAAIYMYRAPLELQLAAWRSGVAAELPGYMPPGYNFDGPVHTSSGSVAFNYKDGSKLITIDQENSSWDSQTLLDSVVTPSGGSYKVTVTNGRTIYFYGQSKATWVNDDIWYSISASPSIGNSELQKIAGSM